MTGHEPLPGYEDVRVRHPKCGTEMFIVQYCGGRNGGASVAHFWCPGCERLMLERAGNYRCVHERPEPGDRVPEDLLKPREPDPLAHLAWKKRWVLYNPNKGVFMGGFSGWGNCWWSDTMEFDPGWSLSGADTFESPDEALKCRSYHDDIGSKAYAVEVECGYFAQPEDLAKAGLHVRDWRTKPD